MPRHTLKLLALLTVFSVAPAAAGHRGLGAGGPHAQCPYERARAEAEARAAAQFAAAAPKAPTTITLIRAPADSMLPGLSRGRFVSP